MSTSDRLLVLAIIGMVGAAVCAAVISWGRL